MATFPRGSSSRPAFTRNEAVKRQANGESQTVGGKVLWHVDPSDAIALRGIPTVGPGCAGGAIFGTRPGTGLS